MKKYENGSFENNYIEECAVSSTPDAHDVVAKIPIDFYPDDENTEGCVVATVSITKHGDIAVDYHDTSVRVLNTVKELIEDSIQALKDYYECNMDYIIKNAGMAKMKSCIYLTFDIFSDAILQATGNSVEVTHSLDGLNYYDHNNFAGENEDITEKVIEALSEYYDVNVISIHKDNAEEVGIWLCYEMKE